MTGLLEPDDFVPAEFSPCRTWRYVLRRRWSAAPPIAFILLNPSTADETKDDPTIRRCIGFARSWRAGGLVLGNLFALRSTDPRALRSHPDPVGPGNDSALLAIVDEVGRDGTVICGWGVHGTLMDRGEKVRASLRDWGCTPRALAMTATGEPGHPLYLPGGSEPFAL